MADFTITAPTQPTLTLVVSPQAGVPGAPGADASGVLVLIP